jgi:hypothetical protein
VATATHDLAAFVPFRARAGLASTGTHEISRKLDWG